METAGTILKNEREKQDLSLKQIALGIKIKKEYLASIENDDYDSLPAEIFTKSYIRMYAEILGIDGEPLIDLYQKQIEPPEQEVPEPRKTIDSSTYRNLAIIIAIAVTIALAIVIFKNDKETSDTTSADISESTPAAITKNVKNKKDELKPERPMKKSPPENETTLKTETANDPKEQTEAPVKITGKKASHEAEDSAIENNTGLAEESTTAKHPAVRGTEAKLPEAAPAAKKQEIREIKKEQPVIEKAAADKEKQEMRTVTTEASDIKKPSASDNKTTPSSDTAKKDKNTEEAKTASGKKHLKVTAMEMTWVAISIDDGKIKEWFLRAGESITLTADEKFVVKTGNAGGTKLILDDREIDAIGPHGKVAEIVLP